MAATISTLVTRITAATPATIAAAFGGGVTAADITDLQKLLTVLADRPNISLPPMSLSGCGLIPS